MELKVKQSIGSRCITKEDGQRVYDAIYPAMNSGETVTLDFEGVTQFASPFFNFAIGQLLKEMSTENLKSLLNIVGLVPEGENVVDRVIENASRYHSDVDYRKIVDTILQQQVAESE